jgi:anti-sigma B factor antagonist
MGTQADPSLTSRLETRNGVACIALSGYLDMSTVPTLNAELEPAERDGAGTILLDLRGLTFVDSSGLHALFRAHERSIGNGQRIFFVGATDQARRIFEITRTDFLLDQDGTAEVLRRFTSDGGRRPTVEEGGDDA